MREFIGFVDAKGKEPVMEFIAQLKQPEADKVVTMLEALTSVDELRLPYFKPLRGLRETLAELIIGPFRIFVHRLDGGPGQERYLLVHMFRKKSNETPVTELEKALKNVIAFRYG